jgi:hypothetical protein
MFPIVIVMGIRDKNTSLPPPQPRSFLFFPFLFTFYLFSSVSGFLILSIELFTFLYVLCYLAASAHFPGLR